VAPFAGADPSTTRDASLRFLDTFLDPAPDLKTSTGFLEQSVQPPGSQRSVDVRLCRALAEAYGVNGESQ